MEAKRRDISKETELTSLHQKPDQVLAGHLSRWNQQAVVISPAQRQTRWPVRANMYT